eukprot:comp23202_c0_seq1/m.37693 comp23202_c0_seq1/g.37693  ORF comp23202_c0_seq1/g.37693 comp23202_c0_seq1/m.37693 type:complete len:416 (-) comp23202_c0_seq1:565-1812(-)
MWTAVGKTAIGQAWVGAVPARAAARYTWLCVQKRAAHAHATNAPTEIACVNPKANTIEVTWADGKSHAFYPLFLRDHCQCSECFHPDTKQRLLDTCSLPLDISAKTAEVSDGKLTINWPDGHTTVLCMDTLKAAVTPTQKYAKKMLWGAEVANKPPQISYDEVMSSDPAGLKKYLSLIREYGFAFVTGTPATPKATQEVSELIGPMKETWFGKLWDFTSNMEHADTAYTNLELEAHTDSTYFTDPAGLQILHCLSFVGTGGKSLLVDGFKAAQDVKEIDPRAYSLLKSIRLPQQYIDPKLGLHMLADSHSIIEDPDTGDLVQVRFNNYDRAPLDYAHVKPSLHRELYSALRLLETRIRAPENEYRFLLTPGNLMIFDNWRVLHGRSAYTGTRRLCGCYIDRDLFFSKLRFSGVGL